MCSPKILFLVLVFLFARFFFCFFLFFFVFHAFYEKRKCRMSSPKILCSVLVFLFALFFSFFFFFFPLAFIFTLLAAPCRPLAFLILKYFHVVFLKKRSPYLSLALTLSLLSTSAQTLKLSGKETLLLFFLCVSPGGHAISRQKTQVPFVFPYLLIELFSIGIPVVRTYDHVTTKISRMHR